MSTPLTGRRVALIAGAAFLLMLIPNIVLTVTAVRTFSGLVVPNSYVASQNFDRDSAAQRALGWQVTVDYADGVLHLAIDDARGHPVRAAALTVVVGRPTTTRDDVPLTFDEMPAGYAAPVLLASGNWRVEIAATAVDGTAFRQSRDILVRP